jgi:hypothetical protein
MAELNASTITSPGTFQGWRRRRGGRWWVECSADTEAECFRRLLDVAERDAAGSFDQVILPAGDRP